MIAISRFRVLDDDEGFRRLAEQAATFFRSRAGCERAVVVQNLDEPTLWALVSDWADVGSYRRGFSGHDAKMILTPILSLALDEPGAFAAPEDVGINQPRWS